MVLCDKCLGFALFAIRSTPHDFIYHYSKNNLLKYSGNYFMAYASLCNYYRAETDGGSDTFSYHNLFKYKIRITETIPEKLSNILVIFCRSLDLSLKIFTANKSLIYH